MVWTPKYTITQEILSDLTKIENVKISFNDKPLSPVLLNSLHKTAKISSTHYSTQIEGNHLTMQQVEATLYTKNKKQPNIKVMTKKRSKPIIMLLVIWKNI